MFKKVLVLALCFLTCSMASFADELSDVQDFFQSYVDAANSYNPKLLDVYLPDAKIIRVVIKPDGTKQSVILPMSRYAKELKFAQKGAMLLRYKNTYSDRSYIKLNDRDYRISALRTPSRDDKKLAFHFIVTKTPESGWKVKEESMETTVQKFLD